MRIVSTLVLAAAAMSLAGCSRKPAPEPGVATPSVSLSRDRAPLGSPIDVTYRFEVAPNAPAFTENYRVFVHVVDADEELMWTDDHDPQVPTKEWKPGQKIEYTRTIFIPIYPYIGDASIQVGLYSPTTSKRVSLLGTDAGLRAYRVAKIQLLPQTENVFTVYKEGWHGPETAQNNVATEWQWTKKDATLAFRNPKKDSVLYLDVDNPSSPMFGDGQKVQIAVNGQTAGDLTVTDKRTLHKIPLTAAQFGDGDMVEVHILVDKTFVPAQVAGAKSKDPRELGVRVFHAFVEPPK